MGNFYFSKYENRRPYSSIPDSITRTLWFQFIAIVTIMTGLAYLHWRWFYSLNENALWFAIPLVIAETLSFIGTVLAVFNFWANKDPEKLPVPHMLSDIEDLNGRADRPVKIDVFIATYNEEVEIVRHTIRDAVNMTYPHKDVTVKVYILDDGRRDGRDPNKENMKKVAEEEGAIYLTRESNEGYKAGNLKNGLEHSDGDIFVILDADVRPFPSFMENTFGYFRNKKLAWVQTPQWFYDTTPKKNVARYIKRKIKAGPFASKIIDRMFGDMWYGEDIYGNDPRLFYDVILRRRNYHNSAFCCGAGSIHRREAVMSLAIHGLIEEVQDEIDNAIEIAPDHNVNEEQIHQLKKKALKYHDLKPFKFHASEDIYTSMMMHAYPHVKWESLQHPHVEAKMLSPQDLDSCVKQRVRYAQGSLDIAFKNNPLLVKGLSWRQKICYLATVWSYFAPLWLIIFLLSPIIFFFTHTIPVTAYSFEFFKYFLPFQILNTITFTIACWGIDTRRGEQYYVSGFWFMLQSLIAAVKGEKVKFNVTPKQKTIGNNMQHIWPHLTIIGLTVIGFAYNIVLLMMNQLPTWSGFFSNTFWSIFNIYSLSIFIRAAYWEEEEEVTAAAVIEQSPEIIVNSSELRPVIAGNQG